jgi:hypothetical protein
MLMSFTKRLCVKAYVKAEMFMRSSSCLRAVLTFMIALLLLSCSDAPTGQQSGNQQFCAQANGFLDKEASGEPRKSRPWGEMMLAGARLVYVTRSCGERVATSKKELCAGLFSAAHAFAASKNVPRGKNRDAAINQNLGAYAAGGCEPELLIE